MLMLGSQLGQGGEERPTFSSNEVEEFEAILAAERLAGHRSSSLCGTIQEGEGDDEEGVRESILGAAPPAAPRDTLRGPSRYTRDSALGVRGTTVSLSSIHEQVSVRCILSSRVCLLFLLVVGHNLVLGGSLVYCKAIAGLALSSIYLFSVTSHPIYILTTTFLFSMT